MLRTIMGSSHSWLENWGLPRSGAAPGAVLLALEAMVDGDRCKTIDSKLSR